MEFINGLPILVVGRSADVDIGDLLEDFYVILRDGDKVELLK